MQRQSTEWISTGKVVKKSNKNPLVQTSMLGFLQQLPMKSSEKATPNASLKSIKKPRKSTALCGSPISLASKRRKVYAASVRRYSSDTWPSERDLATSCTPGRRASSPIVISDDELPELVRDDSTVFSSSATVMTPAMDSARKLKTVLTHEVDVVVPSEETQSRRYSHSFQTPRRIVPKVNTFASSASDTIIPSSQAEEVYEMLSPLKGDSPSVFRIPPVRNLQHPLNTKNHDMVIDDVVPSSQSQHLLPYIASPVRPRGIAREVIFNENEEVVPSSQSQMEIALTLSQLPNELGNVREPEVSRCVETASMRHSEESKRFESTPAGQGLTDGISTETCLSPVVGSSSRLPAQISSVHANSNAVKQGPISLQGCQMEDLEDSMTQQTCPPEFVAFFHRLGSLGSQIEKPNQVDLVEDSGAGEGAIKNPLSEVHEKPSLTSIASVSQLMDDQGSQEEYTFATCPSFVAEFFGVSKPGVEKQGEYLPLHVELNGAKEGNACDENNQLLVPPDVAGQMEAETSDTQSTYTQWSLPVEFAGFFERMDNNSPP